MSSTMVKLEKVCDVIRGVTFKPEDLVPPFTENSIVVMRTKNVQVKGLDYEDLISIPIDLIKDQKKVLIDGDLLISSANSWYLVGKTSFFETNKLASPVTAGGFISIIRPKASIKSKYLYHWLTTDKSQHKIRHLGRQTTNISNLDFKQFKKLEIPLPSLPEQQRIADILDKAEAVTQKREQALALCDEFLRATFLDMFGDPVSNPKGWNTESIGNLTSVLTGSTPSRKVAEYYKGDIPWVKTTEVNGKDIYDTSEKISDKAILESSCKLVPKGSIVMAMYGQGKTRGQVARLKVEAATNQACAVITPTNKIDMDYLYLYLLNSYERLRSLGRGGNQPNLNLNIVKNIAVLVPPTELQQKFSEIVEKVNAIKARIQHAQELPLFDALSQQAFKGELTQ